MDGTEVQLLNTACGSLAYMAGLWMAMAPIVHQHMAVKVGVLMPTSVQ